MIDPSAVAGEVRDLLDREGGRLGLEGRVALRYVANPGGFVNASFTATGGEAKLHVKVARPSDGIERWWANRELLVERYHAPEILGRFRLPSSGFDALVFPDLEGDVPDEEREAQLLPELIALVGRLHADADLAARIEEPAPVTYRSSFEDGLGECFFEDWLAVMGTDEVRGWLSREDVLFLSGESRRLTRLGRDLLPDVECVSPVHGDLWTQNVLVSDREWYVLDWEGLRFGDPASDYMRLLDRQWQEGRDLGHLLPEEPGLQDRVEFLRRAALFDWIVDPLSDCTEMPEGLQRADEVKREKLRVSREALLRYRQLYG